MDLTGAMGGNFFNIGAATATAATANTGTAPVTVTRTNLGALTAQRPTCSSRTATGYTLRRQDTGAAVSFTGTGTVADPILAEGLSIVVGAGIATGDQYTIRPTRDALTGMSVAITDAARVAAAAPIRASAATTNTGTGTVTSGEVLDPTERGAADHGQHRVHFGDHLLGERRGQLHVHGRLQHRRQRLAHAGQRRAGGGRSLSRCATTPAPPATIATLSRWPTRCNANVLDGGTKSVVSAPSRSSPPTSASPRAPRRSIAMPRPSIHDSDIAAQDAVSGVNLDEEAANLLRYQQAYAAAAQIISVANEMFDTLLNAVRR